MGLVLGIIQPVDGIYEASSWLNLICVVRFETRLWLISHPEYAKRMMCFQIRQSVAWVLLGDCGGETYCRVI